MVDRRITINEFLTDAEIVRAKALYKVHHNTGKFAAALVTEIIEPSMTRINFVLGQENDPKYLAYMVEYVFMQTGVAD